MGLHLHAFVAAQGDHEAQDEAEVVPLTFDSPGSNRPNRNDNPQVD
jgi:hypothetical protein